MILTRIEDFQEHPGLVEVDECFYLHKFPAAEVARFLEGKPAVDPRLDELAQRMIPTLTPQQEETFRKRFAREVDEIEPSFAVTRQRIRQLEAGALRRLALRVVARDLAEGLSSGSQVFGNLSAWTLVPIPSAFAAQDDEAEPVPEALASLKGLKRLDPVSRLLNELAGHVVETLDVRVSIREVRPLSPKTSKGEGAGREPTVQELKAAYEVEPEPPGSAGVLLFGDVLGDGARFRACKERLQAAFPGARIVGIFVAKVRG